MEFKSDLSTLESGGLAVPETVCEVLTLQQQLLEELSIFYIDIDNRGSSTGSANNNFEAVMEKEHLLRQHLTQISELQTLMMEIHRAEFSAAFDAVQTEIREEDMRGEQ
jgi:hypothetical protein